MRCASWLGSATICLAVTVTAWGQVDSELERVRDLVQAGALPRNALIEAETEAQQRRYREVLQRTLLSDSLEESEIRSMLDAARGLERITRERFERVMAQLEAHAVPARRLTEAQDRLREAERQVELAQMRADLIRQMDRMVKAESYREELEGFEGESVFRFYGFTEFEYELLRDIGEMYYLTFGTEPPVSAEGDTALHRSMGLDHTGRIDVAVHPDSDEGMFLTYLLESYGIEYIAFRMAVPGQSTGPHIHVGPPSDRIEDIESDDILR